MKLIHLKTIDSTNIYLKSNYETLDDLTWVSTDFQSAGKGRSLKPWFGDHNSLMCSVLLRTKLDFDHIKILPLLAAKSLHKVLSYYDPNFVIKWPNDILINELKVAGILVESIIEGDQVHAVVIGFGVNINNQAFNSEIEAIATSLSLTTGQKIDKENFYQLLIDQFIEDYEYFRMNSQFVIDYCNQHSALKDKRITFIFNNQRVDGKVLYIDYNGHLLVETKTYNLSISSGEITILK